MFKKKSSGHLKPRASHLKWTHSVKVVPLVGFPHVFVMCSWEPAPRDLRDFRVWVIQKTTDKARWYLTADDTSLGLKVNPHTYTHAVPVVFFPHSVGIGSGASNITPGRRREVRRGGKQSGEHLWMWQPQIHPRFSWAAKSKKSIKQVSITKYLSISFASVCVRGQGIKKCFSASNLKPIVHLTWR